MGEEESILQCDPAAQSRWVSIRDNRPVPVSGTERPIGRENRVFCQDFLTDPFDPFEVGIFP